MIIEVWAGVAGVLGLAVCGLAWALSRQHRDMQALEQRLQAMQQHLEEEIRMTSRGAFGVGKRLMDTEKRVSELIERVDQMENLHAADTQSRQARRILQKTGADEELTRNEAKLAALLKGEAEEEFP